VFGFRRKSEGFEWREYVRTTVLVRRQRRRDRVIDARDAAVEGVRDAGSAGARRFIQLMKTAGSALASAPRRAGKSIEASAKPALRSILTSLRGLRPALVPIAILGAAATAVHLLHSSAGRSGVLTLTSAVSRPWLLLLPVLAAIAAVAVVYRGTWASRFSLPKGLANPFAGLAVAARRVPTRVRYAGLACAALLPALWLGWGAWRGSAPTTMIASIGVPFLAGQTIEGKASAVSGDVIRIGGRDLRLAGIEAPDREQRCAGATGSKWRCGEAAAEALAKAVRNRKLVCQTNGIDDAGRLRATCRAGADDIAAKLVKDGAVFATGSVFASYAAEERDAKIRKAGLWRATPVERPADWRAKVWETARKAAPEGCPIKGQITSSGKKSYLVPWHGDYDSAKVRTSRGERWFCSESEAAGQGFRPAT
jgi:endonuclease YncB( thermonuclease family)